ncbi:MAG: hypothetical protein Q4B85_02100 [Lachnospiraceae bacterium]|nr:hypothetical protein [Lachnospiraceae bacterium]
MKNRCQFMVDKRGQATEITLICKSDAILLLEKRPGNGKRLNMKNRCQFLLDKKGQATETSYKSVFVAFSWCFS